MKYKEGDEHVEKFYRVSYCGVGIYQSLKNNINEKEWKNFLKSKDVKWLPKPPDYLEFYRSYFTKGGFDVFIEKTMPIIKKYLDFDKISIDEVSGLKNIVYEDTYQIIVEENNLKWR